MILLLAMALCAFASAQEATLGIVKPDGIAHLEAIKSRVAASGFRIAAHKHLRLTESQAEEFYAEHSGRDFFPQLVHFMSSGPVLAMQLEKPNAVEEWRQLIGPTDPVKARVSHPQSLRADCGTSVQRNCVHGSDSPTSAARELDFFFRDAHVDEAPHQEL